MRRDVHLAALRAASKVAFSFAVLNGCGGATSTPESANNDHGNDNSGNSSDVIASEPSKTPGNPSQSPAPSVPADSGLADSGGAACADLLDKTFSDTGPTTRNPPPPVKACCVALIKDEIAKNSFEESHHWSCCGVTNWGQDVPMPEDHQFACTPWGPPVPPAMTRRALREVA
jgi:hypothetical protein